MRKPKVLKMSGEKGSPPPNKTRQTLPWEQHPEQYVYQINVAGHSSGQEPELEEYLSSLVYVTVYPGLIETEYVRADEINETADDIVAELKRIDPGCKPRVIIYERCAEVPE